MGIWHTLKLNTIHKSITDRGADKLSVAKGNASPKINFNQLKEIFTDPYVVEMYKIGSVGSYLNIPNEWVGRIINGCAQRLPAENVFDFAKFLVDDYVTNKVIHGPSRIPIRDIGFGLSLTIEKTPANKKSAMADILAKHDFGRIIFGKGPYLYFIEWLAIGLNPKEFDDILTRTKFLAEAPSNEHMKELIIDDHFIGVIARNALLNAEPNLREKFESEKIIEDIRVKETIKQQYTEQARKIVEIAFSHCKGAHTKSINDTISNKKRMFSFIDNNLMDDENIAYRAKLHWIVFFWPIICFLISTTIFVFFYNNGTLEDAIIFACLPMVVTVLTSIGPFVNYFTSEFGVTDKRVVAKFGFIKRRSLEVLIKKVESILVDQSILGRILGYGTVVIIGSGATKERFAKIQTPLNFRKKVQEQISAIGNE